ncbi:MAG: thioredoxin family protein [Bacteroidales bacterium]|nr:thioredoxin family protein [Bacteroidales bacterium]
MKKILVLLFCGLFLSGMAQDKVKIYNPEADAAADLKIALEQADAQNKHVFIQLGGNWCPWCIRFHHYIQETAVVDSILKADYIVLKINYSKENKNVEMLERFDFPQRFGFPVFVILDANGKRLHTQDSGFLESGKGYDEKKVMTFLRSWTPMAVNPETYSDKK